MQALIQWPTAKYWDKQWNPMIGCKPCSPACENCYAAAWARRFGQSFKPHDTKQRPPRNGIVFCGNMTDLFGEWMYTEDIANNIGRCVNRGGDAYLWLTKRPARVCGVLRNEKVLLIPEGYDEDSGEYFGFDDEECDISNHYFGFTAENQEWWDMRIGEADFPEGIKWWVSCEPLLGPIDLWLHAKTVLADGRIAKNNKPSWVVVGCESGPHRRPCKIEWVESIVEQCRTAKLPVFVKQLDINGRCVTDITKFPKHLQIRQVPWATTKGENRNEDICSK